MSVKTVNKIGQFWAELAKGNDCNYSGEPIGEERIISIAAIKGIILATDDFMNEYVPIKSDDGKYAWLKTYDKYKGVHNDVIGGKDE